jgi:2',3'-cyclic-nucleotide 2'-phosphodiesterase (5'-nucleotidase family)
MHKYGWIFFIIIITFFLGGCTKKIQHIADVVESNYSIEKGSTAVDRESTELIEPYKAKLDLTMNDVIGYNPTELLKGKPNSGLTSWFVDVLYDQTKKLTTDGNLDFVLQNYGGIRISSLAAGDVTVGKMYELMPFDNIMFIMTLDSTTIHQMCDKFVASQGYPVSKNVRVEMSYGKAGKITIKGEPLSAKRKYIVGVPDYIANGGDDMSMLVDKPRINTGVMLRDMLIGGVKEITAAGKKIEFDPSERIY